MKISVIGLGMMGCSLAHSLKQAGFYIIGCDINTSHCQQALKFNIVNDILTLEESDIQSDVMFLVTPPSSIVHLSKKLDVNNNTVYADFSSLKVDIVSNINKSIRKRFIASHPMCGTEKSGPDGYKANLYKNKTLIICNKEDNDYVSLNKVLDIYKKMHMNIIYMDSKVHDEYIGYISHLPHVVSFALANSVLSQTKPLDIVNLRGAGFESMSRLAKSSPELWSDIFCNNRKNIRNSLEVYMKNIQEFLQYLDDNDKDKIKDFIKKSNKLQDLF
jgi:prephenate dehydrogenase